MTKFLFNQPTHVISHFPLCAFSVLMPSMILSLCSSILMPHVCIPWTTIPYVGTTRVASIPRAFTHSSSVLRYVVFCMLFAYILISPFIIWPIISTFTGFSRSSKYLLILSLILLGLLFRKSWAESSLLNLIVISLVFLDDFINIINIIAIY